jgi:hypothetical protein
MRTNAINAQTQKFGISLLEFIVNLGEGHEFRRANWSEVSRVGKQNKPHA